MTLLRLQLKYKLLLLGALVIATGLISEAIAAIMNVSNTLLAMFGVLLFLIYTLWVSLAVYHLFIRKDSD